jgi:hypothetical protein
MTANQLRKDAKASLNLAENALQRVMRAVDRDDLASANTHAKDFNLQIAKANAKTKDWIVQRRRESA